MSLFLIHPNYLIESFYSIYLNYFSYCSSGKKNYKIIRIDFLKRTIQHLEDSEHLKAHSVEFMPFQKSPCFRVSSVNSWLESRRTVLHVSDDLWFFKQISVSLRLIHLKQSYSIYYTTGFPLLITFRGEYQRGLNNKQDQRT